MYACTFTADQVRRAEAPLLEAESFPDELMQSAAHAVFQVAEDMLSWPSDCLERWTTRWSAGGASEAGGVRIPHDPDTPGPARTLVLAGPGGNGGDGLYAGAELALAGHPVDAWLTADTAHERALAAFRNAGGTVLSNPPWEDTERARNYRLVIDAITGIGTTASLREELAELVELLKRIRAAVLAVDIPSGINADTGQPGALHITADVTVTFGGWRHAHVLAPQCGLQLLAGIGLPEMPLDKVLVENMPEWAEDGPDLLVANRTVIPEHPTGQWPSGIVTLKPAPAPDITPGHNDNKYTGGVVGIRAGSSAYPGAAILCAMGAVNATPAMVRYAGPQALEVVRALPEVVATDTLEDTGRVQTWVFGPGVGTGEAAAAELRWLLEHKAPLLIDADGLTLLSTHPDLRERLAARTSPTVLTPHDGEFTRLWEAAGLEASESGVSAPGRFAETLTLGATLECTIVRKGRVTIIAPEDDPYIGLAVDAGHSWAATPGSGDVLAGVLGAHLARIVAQMQAEEDARKSGGAVISSGVGFSLADAVSVHAAAAKLAAETPYGDATAPASRIAQFIRDATAKLNTVH